MADQAQSLFNESSTEPQSKPEGSTSTTPPQSDPMQDLLLQIKNERGEPKYKSVQDALVGLQHAQSHIQTLLNEKRTVDEELNTLRPVASKVTELEKVVQQLTQSNTPPTSQPEFKGLSEEQIATLVEQTMTRKQQDEVAKANVASIVDSVRKAFGDKAEETFYSKAKELGMDVASFNQLAAHTPAAVMRLLGIDKPSTPQQGTKTTSSVNTTAFNPNTESFIGRNKTPVPVGATSAQLQASYGDARKMVEEMREKGMSMDDMTKPSNYFKYFGQ